ncbi:MAG: CBS domain-containing protein [Alphaproteobacteria bacterium]|nr:CBS domain-containing protein [Alphaproteobacteria bacterium]
MDCRTMMAPIKTSLFADEPAARAIDFMVEKHMGLVPVTERDGTFAGLISGDSLMGFMLPKTISIMSRVERAMSHASYLDESAEEMQERLVSVRGKTIGELVDRQVRTVTPDTPLIDALMLITGKQYVVPVVDEENKLLGAISFFSVLYGLHEEYDRETAQKAKQKERAQRKLEKEAARKKLEEESDKESEE